MVRQLLSISLALLCLPLIGCSEEEKAADPPVLSQKGESCRVRSDCQSGLACVSQVCITGEFSISETANECAIIECSQASDCCPTLSSQCQYYQQDCQQGSQSACEYFDQMCKCNPQDWSCEQGACRAHMTCSQTKPCPGNWQCHWDSSTCFECMEDSNCFEGKVCWANQCVNKCNLDSDCPGFHRCQDSICVESGCQSDRECAAATKNALAVCVDQKCLEPCQTNLECGDPEHGFTFKACINGQCTYVGCETDKECQLYLGQTGDGQHTQIVCRPMQ